MMETVSSTIVVFFEVLGNVKDNGCDRSKKMSNRTDFSTFGYRLIKIIGQNQHQGRITYLAEELAGRHRVVIKFQFAGGSLSWSVRDVLEREIKILQQLEHPRIPRYIDSFEDDDGFYLIQEYKDAPSLAEVELFTPTQIKAITISVLEILVYLQDKIPTVVHRDIKPANILVDRENNAYLVDFGFGRLGGDEVTGSSVVRGTPGFMPPEQLWGRLTKASDLYSLGMTTICLLGGIDSSNICDRINNDYQVDIRSLVSGVSDRFLEWLEKIVQPNPNHRYQDARTAKTALQSIEIVPSAVEQKALLQQNNTKPIWQWLTLKSTIVSLIFGAIVGIAWGITHQLPRVGLSLGILLGVGLSLVLLPRKSKFLAIPPWQSMVGAIATAIAVGLVINPTILLYSGRYLSFAAWKHHHHQVASGKGFVLYTDVVNSEEDRRYSVFLAQFRQEVAENLFVPGKSSCITNVHLLKQDKNYFAVANRFGLKTSYGFYLRPPWHKPIVVVREDSGLGTLTHQMIYHYLDCSYPVGLPLWARQGAATFVEKFVALEERDRLAFSWGYRSNWRDARVRKTIATINLEQSLLAGKQSVIRSFFLFLHHQQLLFPLLDRLHGEKGDGIERIEQIFQQPIAIVDQQWKQWLLHDALNLPMVESSFMAWDKDANRVRKYLNYYWLWDKQKQMWIRSPQPDRDYIIPRLEKILDP